MAQNKLDFFIASHVQGMEDVSKLINRVGALEKELKRLAAANGVVATSTNAVIQNGKRYNNALDAQSRALRQQRQGLQQVGLQMNDFATSVSTGASPLQAFNQQLGQLGYAMSLMGGTAGRVGAFLAGPWGAAITLAAAGLGVLWSQTGKAEEKIDDLGQAFDFTKITGEQLAQINQLLSDSNKEVARTSIQAATAAAQQAAANRDGARAALDKAKAELLALRALQASTLASPGMSKAGVEATGGEAARLDALIKRVDQKINGPDGLQAAVDKFTISERKYTAQVVVQTAALDANGRKQEAIKANLNVLQTLYEQNAISLETLQKASARANAELRALEKTTSSPRRARSDRSSEAKDRRILERNLKAAIETLNKPMEQYRKVLEGISRKEMPEHERQIMALTEAYNSMSAAQQAVMKSGFEQAIAALEYDPKGFVAEIEKLTEKDLPEWQRQISALTDKFSAMNITGQTESLGAYRHAIDAIANEALTELGSKYTEATSKQSEFRKDAAMLDETFKLLRAELEAAGAPVTALTIKYLQLKGAMANVGLIEANKELKRSYESVGNAVSDAFKGMLSGATSWKDGMKGIIRAVIDELWRLYVVQQIVGLVTKGLGSLGLPAAGGVGQNALGTQNWKGGMTWVGERGPELVNLPKGSQVIPAHRAQNMNSGGTVINVDARGASDPEAVRRQVQLGIMEAAPQIVAASEARTLQTLRRPRLGGAVR